MRGLLLLPLALAGCGAVLDAAVSTRVDSDCVAATNHVKACDDRFNPGALCVYTEGRSGGAGLSHQQSDCILKSSCATICAALDQREYLCGYPVADRRSPTNPPPPTRSPAKPDERGD